MSKIYVIHWGHAYETGSWPYGVYSTIEKAKEAFTKACDGTCDFVELLEYDLDGESNLSATSIMMWIE